MFSVSLSLTLHHVYQMGEGGQGSEADISAQRRKIKEKTFKMSVKLCCR